MRIVAGLTVAALAAGTLGATAAQAEKITWNHSIWGNPRSFTVAIETMAEYVKEHSGGNFEIAIHYGSTLSPERENLDSISLGAIESAHVCSSYHPGKNPVSTVLDLPFLPIDTTLHLQHVHEGFAATDYHKEELERWSGRFMMSGINPLFEAMGRGQPLRTIEDWRGVRVRALGGIGAAFRKLGAVPTTVTAPEVYNAIERGVVQVVTFPYAYPFGAYRTYEVSNWYSAGMNLGVPWCFVVMGEKAWQDLPDEYKQLIMDGKDPSYDAKRADFEKSEAHWEAIFDERLERVEYSEEVFAELQRLGGQPVWEEWVVEMEGKGVPGQKLLDIVLELADKHRPGS
jgi:TRAP-type C4-dicarboxylate transport system substrate-binding protein